MQDYHNNCWVVRSVGLIFLLVRASTVITWMVIVKLLFFFISVSSVSNLVRYEYITMMTSCEISKINFSPRLDGKLWIPTCVVYVRFISQVF